MQDNSPAPDLQHHSSLAAVLMAAGAGARMGQRPKSLLELDGVPLICRQVMALRQAGVSELVLVLGHHAKEIEAAAQTTTSVLTHAKNSTVASQLRECAYSVLEVLSLD